MSRTTRSTLTDIRDDDSERGWIMAFDVTGKFTQPVTASVGGSPVGPPKRPAAQASMLKDLLENASDDHGRNNVLRSTAQYIGDKSVAARLIADNYEYDAGVAEALEILYGTARAPDIEGDPTHDGRSTRRHSRTFVLKAMTTDGLQSYFDDMRAVHDRPGGLLRRNCVDILGLRRCHRRSLKELYGALPSGADGIAPADLKRMFDAVSDDSEYAAIVDNIANYITDVHAAADIIAAAFTSDSARSDALGALYDAGSELVPFENLRRYLSDCSDDAERVYMLEKLRSSIDDKDAAASAIEPVFDSEESFANAVTVLKGFTYVERDDEAGDIYIAPSNPTWRDRWESAYATAKGAVVGPMGYGAYGMAVVNEAAFCGTAAGPQRHRRDRWGDNVRGRQPVGYGFGPADRRRRCRSSGWVVGLGASPTERLTSCGKFGTTLSSSPEQAVI